MNEYKKNNELQIWKDNNFESLSQLVTNILSAKYEVKKIVNSTGNFEDLTCNLTRLVDEKVEGLPEELKLVASQCLMRDYSLYGDVEKNIYNAWYQTIKISRLL